MQQGTTFEQGGKVYEVRAIATLNVGRFAFSSRASRQNGFTYSVDSEVYQDAPIDGVPEDLVVGLMETAERDFRRGLAQELVAAEKATVLIYVDASKEVGDVDHLKVFANDDAAERWFVENDQEGVAFEYEVIEE
jgi:hypothetical protein